MKRKEFTVVFATERTLSEIHSLSSRRTILQSEEPFFRLKNHRSSATGFPATVHYLPVLEE